MFKKMSTAYIILKTEGIKYLFLLLKSRILKQKARSLSLINTFVTKGKGLEIGGKSSIFDDNYMLPIYANIQQLDNCNFNADTLWSNQQTTGNTYNYHPSKAKGHQFIADASDLANISSESYDFLLSSHALEHLANPIKALYAWKRILKNNGHFILVVPHKEGTFDRKRPITPLHHLIEDFQNHIQEDDLTHLEESLALHDFSKTNDVNAYQNFKELAINNIDNRILHHHVFNTLLLAELIDYIGMEIKTVEVIWPMHILIVAQKTMTNCKPANEIQLSLIKSPKFKSPFSSDRI